jgi:NAD(P)-dependent dehydrogenase (short-subunit alcohol dehydrogenase family)
MELNGCAAVVTGGASGIGAGITKRLRDEGARTLVWDIADGADVKCDVSDPESVAAAMADTKDQIGVPTAFVTCAGVGSHARVEAIEVDDWDRTFAINVRGVMLCMQAFIRELRVIDSPGSFVAISSISAVVADPALATYSATKAAVNQLVRVAAREQGQYGIRVKAVAPGPTLTPLSAGLLGQPGWKEEIVERTPLREVGQPEYIAEAVAGALRMDWVTGDVITADGGAALVTARVDRRP